MPVEVYVFPVGDSVRVHEPVEGSPLRTTLPDELQVAAVIVPMDGAVAVTSELFIETVEDDPEEHEPAETVQLYVVPPARLLTV